MSLGRSYVVWTGYSLVPGNSASSTGLGYRGGRHPLAVADGIEFGVHAGAVVAGDVAEQFVAPGRQGDGGPGGGPGTDAVTGIGAAGARGLAQAAGLIDLSISADGPLTWILAGTQRQQDHLVGQPPRVVP